MRGWWEKKKQTEMGDKVCQKKKKKEMGGKGITFFWVE